ncbi:hypothetical protein MMC30_003654 [Trapelia coarctata]|nr:hypothetical protein [Trapelia coarctata]
MFRALLKTSLRGSTLWTVKPTCLSASQHTSFFVLKLSKNQTVQIRSSHQYLTAAQFTAKLEAFDAEMEKLRAETERNKVELEQIKTKIREGNLRYWTRMRRIIAGRGPIQRTDSRARQLHAEKAVFDQRLQGREERALIECKELIAKHNNLMQRLKAWRQQELEIATVNARAYWRAVAHGVNDPNSPKATAILMFTEEEHDLVYPKEPDTPSPSQLLASLFTPPTTALSRLPTEPNPLGIFDGLQTPTADGIQLENEDIPLSHQSREESALSLILGGQHTRGATPQNINFLNHVPYTPQSPRALLMVREIQLSSSLSLHQVIGPENPRETNSPSLLNPDIQDTSKIGAAIAALRPEYGKLCGEDEDFDQRYGAEMQKIHAESMDANQQFKKRVQQLEAERKAYEEKAMERTERFLAAPDNVGAKRADFSQQLENWKQQLKAEGEEIRALLVRGFWRAVADGVQDYFDDEGSVTLRLTVAEYARLIPPTSPPTIYSAPAVSPLQPQAQPRAMPSELPAPTAVQCSLQ